MRPKGAAEPNTGGHELRVMEKIVENRIGHGDDEVDCM